MFLSDVVNNNNVNNIEKCATKHGSNNLLLLPKETILDATVAIYSLCVKD